MILRIIFAIIGAGYTVMFLSLIFGGFQPDRFSTIAAFGVMAFLFTVNALFTTKEAAK
jgi:hypothetical protein